MTPPNPPSAWQVRSLRASDLPHVADLATAGRWAALRHLSLFGHPVAGEEQASRVEELTATAGAHLVLTDGDTVVGQATARPISDLADHFHLPVHEVGPILTLAELDPSRRGAARLLLRSLLEQVASADGPAMVFVRIEGDDHEALAGAQDAGFRLRETSLTFVNDLERAQANHPPRAGADVRVHRWATDGPLPDHLLDTIGAAPGQFSDGHYHADPRLPQDRCDALYQRVRDRVIRGIGADAMVIRYVDDRVVGFGTWRRCTELEPFGVAMAGSSFGYRLPGATGGHLQDVATHVCANPIAGNRLLEWSTQATNYPMVNMLCRQPSIRLCRTSQVLHAWTDEA